MVRVHPPCPIALSRFLHNSAATPIFRGFCGVFRKYSQFEKDFLQGFKASKKIIKIKTKAYDALLCTLKVQGFEGQGFKGFDYKKIVRGHCPNARFLPHYVNTK